MKNPGVDPMAQALGLERYPLVALREDLGETLLEGERELVIRSMDAIREVIRLRARDKANVGRGDHAKSLGCYPAEFTVSSPDVVAADDQAGIAARGHLGRTFPALVRFSNSEPKDVSDFRSATVGLAVKVMLDPAEHPKEEFLFDIGSEQDFVAGGLDTFVSRNLADYTDLVHLRVHPVANSLTITLRHPDAVKVFFVEPHLRGRFGPDSAPLLLEKRFSSLLPYAWGNAAVKYRFEPCHAFAREKVAFDRLDDDDYQAEVIAQFLQSHDIAYVMKIQMRPRPGTEDERIRIDPVFPIDDATVAWPEPGSGRGPPVAEFREVARITIKAGTPALDATTCERLAFNPWNGLKAHQPLGSLSRARLAVYKASELLRTELYETLTPP